MGERAKVYTRLSKTYDGADSTDRQREAAEALVTGEGYAYDPERDYYTDEGRSAYKEEAERPAFDRLVADLQGADVLVAWKADRLTRRVSTAVRLWEAAQAAGVQAFHFVNGGRLDTSDETHFLMAILEGWRGQSEASNIGVRVADKQRKRRRQGKFFAGRPPYGWQAVEAPDGDGSVLALDPAEAPVALRMVEEILEGESCTAIALALNEEGVPTRRGGEWRGGNISRMMRNPALVGWVTHKGEVVRDDHGRPLEGPEPLLDLGTWRRVCDELDDRGPGTVSAHRATLLSGLVVCAECGHTMGGHRSGHAPSYGCRSRRRHGTDCPGNTVSMPRLDAFMEEVVREYVREAVPAEVARRRSERPSETDAQDEVEEVREALRRLTRDRSAGVYDGATAEEFYREEFARLTARLDEAQERADAVRTVDDPASALEEAAELVRGWGEGVPDEARNKVMRQLVEAVVVTKAGEAVSGRDGSYNVSDRVKEVRWTTTSR